MTKILNHEGRFYTAPKRFQSHELGGEFQDDENATTIERIGELSLIHVLKSVVN